jgi:hypothetical protein
MNTLDFIKTIDELRKNNKQKWYFWSGQVAGKEVVIKGYETWLQIFRIDGLNYPSSMDIKVSVFKDHLKNGVQS